MKIISSLIIIALFCSQAFSATNKNEIPAVIDGEIIKSKRVGNDYFLNIDDLKKILGWEVKTTSDAISITTRQKDKLAPTSEIKGVITYYFNSNYGTKPDIGANIYLIEGGQSFSPSADTAFMPLGDQIVLADRNSEKRTQYKIISRTVADGSGIFSIKGIKPGKYTAIIKSTHAKGSTFLEIIGKIYITNIELSGSDAIDISHDFGLSSH